MSRYDEEPYGFLYYLCGLLKEDFERSKKGLAEFLNRMKMFNNGAEVIISRDPPRSQNCVYFDAIDMLQKDVWLKGVSVEMVKELFHTNKYDELKTSILYLKLEKILSFDRYVYMHSSYATALSRDAMSVDKYLKSYDKEDVEKIRKLFECLSEDRTISFERFCIIIKTILTLVFFKHLPDASITPKKDVTGVVEGIQLKVPYMQKDFDTEMSNGINYEIAIHSLYESKRQFDNMIMAVTDPDAKKSLITYNRKLNLCFEYEYGDLCYYGRDMQKAFLIFSSLIEYPFRIHPMALFSLSFMLREDKVKWDVMKDNEHFIIFNYEVFNLKEEKDRFELAIKLCKVVENIYDEAAPFAYAQCINNLGKIAWKLGHKIDGNVDDDWIRNNHKYLEYPKHYFEKAKEEGLFYAFNNLSFCYIEEMTKIDLSGGYIKCGDRTSFIKALHNYINILHESAKIGNAYAANTLAKFYMDREIVARKNGEKIMNEQGAKTLKITDAILESLGTSLAPSEEYSFIDEPTTNRERGYFFFKLCLEYFKSQEESVWAAVNLLEFYETEIREDGSYDEVVEFIESCKERNKSAYNRYQEICRKNIEKNMTRYKEE